MHSGIFMSGVIFVLEVWLLIRQTDKYIIPTLADPNNKYSFFRVVFTNTSNIWLLLSYGAAMFFYCLFYKKMKGNNKRLLPIIIASAISLVFCALMPFEFIYSSRPIEGVKLYLLIVFYASVIVFNITTIVASIYQYKGRNNPILTSVAIISLFALGHRMGILVSSVVQLPSRFTSGFAVIFYQFYFAIGVMVVCLILFGVNFAYLSKKTNDTPQAQ